MGEFSMREGLDLLAGLYPHCFGRENRRPLKVGICEEVIAQHPEMSRHRIKRVSASLAAARRAIRAI
jgi:hypothetical protein